MLTFLFRRLLLTVPVLWGVSTLVFFLIHLTPGDPVVMMLGEQAAAADVEALRHQLGLDLPLATQYGRFLQGLATGDLGASIRTERPVWRFLAERIPATAQLTLAAMLVAIGLSLPLGVLAAVNRGKWVDRAAGTFSLVGISTPNFWLGPLLMSVVAVKLDLLPVSGRGGLAHLALPAITLGLALSALLTRMTRASLLEVLGEQYMRTARAKGLPPWRLYFSHALRNALIPVVTIIGLQFGALLAGTVITETIFSWPGVGRLLIQAIQSRDYPLTQGCVLFIALAYTAATTLTDLLYGVLDPRIRVGS